MSNTAAELALPELKIGLVHGRLKSAEKQQIMQQFASGELQLLVATTVIEVGVDVPNASLMIIENPERLSVLRDSNDGFVIAQRDLEIRGPGELLGTRQTGLASYKIADLSRDQQLIPAAQQIIATYSPPFYAGPTVCCGGSQHDNVIILPSLCLQGLAATTDCSKAAAKDINLLSIKIFV